MSGKIWMAAIVTAAGLLAAGCRSTKPAAQEQPKQEAAQQAEAPQQHGPEQAAEETGEWRTLVGAFDCEVKGIEGTGQVRVAKDSVVWISLSKIIELGRVMFTRDSVFVYVKVTNQYFKGSYADAGRILGIEADYGLIEGMFMGEQEFINKPWLRAAYGDWRELKGRKYPYEMRASVRCKLATGSAGLKYRNVRVNEQTTYPYNVPKLARPLEIEEK